jgi:hypothetical protein
LFAALVALLWRDLLAQFLLASLTLNGRLIDSVITSFPSTSEQGPDLFQDLLNSIQGSSEKCKIASDWAARIAARSIAVLWEGAPNTNTGDLDFLATYRDGIDEKVRNVSWYSGALGVFFPFKKGKSEWTYNANRHWREQTIMQKESFQSFKQNYLSRYASVVLSVGALKEFEMASELVKIIDELNMLSHLVEKQEWVLTLFAQYLRRELHQGQGISSTGPFCQISGNSAAEGGKQYNHIVLNTETILSKTDIPGTAGIEIERAEGCLVNLKAEVSGMRNSAEHTHQRVRS